MILTLLSYLGTFVKNQLDVEVWLYRWVSFSDRFIYMSVLRQIQIIDAFIVHF